MSQDVSLECVDCPVCGPSKTRVWLDDHKPTRYLRCLGCGTVYASPRSHHAVRYAWLDNTFSMNDEILDLMNPRLPALQIESTFLQKHISQGKMLDVGCSIGALFDFFPTSHWERFGVELIPSAAEYAAQKYAAQVAVGTLYEAHYPADYFDLVTLIDTLYYVDDPWREMREIHRVLQPGGWLGIEIAGQAYILWRNYGLVPYLLDRRWSRAGSDSSYLYWFSPQGLRRLLEKAGFSITAWYVVPSPIHRNKFFQFITNIHYKWAKLLAAVSFRTLSWSPKYLAIAQKNN